MPNPTQESLLARLLAPKTIPELRSLRRQLQEDLDNHRVAMTLLRRDLEQVEGVIAERTGSRGPRAGGRPRRTASRNGQPSLRQNLLRLFDEDPQPLHRDAILAALEARGTPPGGQKPRNTLNSRLLEMTSRGELASHGDGIYGPPTRNDEGAPIE